jgi:hypothetical protein
VRNSASHPARPTTRRGRPRRRSGEPEWHLDQDQLGRLGGRALALEEGATTERRRRSAAALPGSSRLAGSRELSAHASELPAKSSVLCLQLRFRQRRPGTGPWRCRRGGWHGGEADRLVRDDRGGVHAALWTALGATSVVGWPRHGAVTAGLDDVAAEEPKAPVHDLRVWCRLRQQRRNLLEDIVGQRWHLGRLAPGVFPDLLQAALPLMVLPREFIVLQRRAKAFVLLVQWKAPQAVGRGLERLNSITSLGLNQMDHWLYESASESNSRCGAYEPRRWNTALARGRSGVWRGQRPQWRGGYTTDSC